VTDLKKYSKILSQLNLIIFLLSFSLIIALNYINSNKFLNNSKNIKELSTKKTTILDNDQLFSDELEPELDSDIKLLPLLMIFDYSLINNQLILTNYHFNNYFLHKNSAIDFFKISNLRI